MNQQNKTKKQSGGHQTKLNREYTTFLQLHLQDLKYMTPWTQYENDSTTISINESKNKSKEDINKIALDLDNGI